MTRESIGKDLGVSPVWLASDCLGMNSDPKEKAAAIVEYLALNAEVGDALEAYPTTIWDQAVPTDPLVYRFYENLTVQIVRVEDLPEQTIGEIYHELSELPVPPLLDARMHFDGYRINRELHGSSRSHVHLAVDEQTDAQVVFKTPSVDLQEDGAYLERLLLEEWIARRISSAHVLKPCPQTRARNYIYTVTEYIDGQTLAQWMVDHPSPDVETVRGIVDQIAKGLRAFHRLEMLHQDLRPENINSCINNDINDGIHYSNCGYVWLPEFSQLLISCSIRPVP